MEISKQILAEANEIEKFEENKIIDNVNDEDNIFFVKKLSKQPTNVSDKTKINKDFFKKKSFTKQISIKFGAQSNFKSNNNQTLMKKLTIKNEEEYPIRNDFLKNNRNQSTSSDDNSIESNTDQVSILN